MSTNPPQLFLLADHIKLSLLERQRAISLNLSPNSQDSQISRSLGQLRSGIESLESQTADKADESISSALPRLRAQLAELSSQFDTNPSSATPTSPTLTSPNDPSLASDFAAATSKKPRAVSKSVRFTDTPDTAVDEDAARAALFPYRDNPSADRDVPDQSHLDNQQIHQYHSQVIRDQDEQLDRLGASIGRQRELSMQIGDELDDHVMLLDEVEEGVDRHAAQFVRARGRLDRFSKKARENWSLTVIVVLIIILVLLIVITK
ncbi:SNARE complex subunit [Amniculicola lignicola CBS 123094]|uniref:SNARE complex subunit n=1 Tax=Amniculicola lignicola CBS 123094 TaxID=1392246 RepID=A0A6A5WVZ6_9PLEO|nr:SNARE complex subunit [Amniculicola lignicola CBS 123094]